jgi:hypothetical protein
MAAKTTRLAALSFALRVALESPGHQPTGWQCLECREALDVHQPDAGNPGRLLATCPECGDWYILDDLDDDGSRCLMIRLPAPMDVERALEEAAGPAESGDWPRIFGVGSKAVNA